MMVVVVLSGSNVSWSAVSTVLPREDTRLLDLLLAETDNVLSGNLSLLATGISDHSRILD